MPDIKSLEISDEFLIIKIVFFDQNKKTVGKLHSFYVGVVEFLISKYNYT